MKYASTRGGIAPIPFRDAVMMGLARDGGLLLPESFPQVADRLESWASLSYPDLAFEVIRLFADDIPEADLRTIINKSYATFTPAPDGRGGTSILPVKAVGPVHVMELYHGPTLAFKDVALQFLGNLFEYILGATGQQLNIVVATSGDTGSAAIHGVRGRKGIRIFVLHPAGRVSPVQELQMTSVLDDNVFNIALGGTFDDAQGIVKQLFSDLPFKDAHNLGAVNSINWARVLAQVVYYFWGYFRAAENPAARTPVSFTVPTGNFGDIFAGYVAAKMGLPVRRLVLATNENDILSRFFATGRYERGSVVPTLSPSMDIQIASNFERWIFLHENGDAAKVAALMKAFKETGRIELPKNADGSLDPWIRAGRGDTEATLSTIRDYHERFGYLMDPHTAVGVSVAECLLEPGTPMICLSTAHPAKFPGAIEQATGDASLALTPAVEALKGSPTRKFPLPAETKAVADFVAART